MDRPLYLHETVDIVGRGGAPYMAHVVGFDANAVADRGLELAGTWEVVGTTGRWPQVVNLWRFVDGWDGWNRLTTRTNVDKAANAELAAWWDDAFQHRSGGVDRLLASVPGAPDLIAEAAAGRQGEIAIHELTRVHAGMGPRLRRRADQPMGSGCSRVRRAPRRRLRGADARHRGGHDVGV